MNDLLLQINNTTFQIDSIIINTDEIHLFEIKNYGGDYYYQNDRIYTMNHKEISNPLNKIRRDETLFKQLLHKHGWENKTTTSSVVFSNPEFTLITSSPIFTIYFSNAGPAIFKKNESSFRKSEQVSATIG
ncbi:hypothetical protein CHH55_17380 [Niallia circulans]|uniref:nuclease-related domain-containing protein n=1 Tax=Niallia TaxID=2837506 RepID=UPI0009E2F903|nr:nuclease-related domain-containing protein [Niallia circulans]NRG30879.1 NERD domain-containing protein [Niallia circulans]PAD25524.1 hypothetical protein CHH62_12125 [Niallia circulans]PAD86578.1 hypothetical protein CHH55_17380 [Niallia circulans]PAE10160.1 hypothetical protein CHI02_21570 [Niallia circulans]